MSEHYGFFLPVNKKDFNKLRISGDVCNSLPHFSIPNKTSTVKLFIDALLRNAPEEAFCYMSRAVPSDVDFREIQGILNDGVDIKFLIKAEEKVAVREKRGGIQTNSILIINKERRNSIMHVHLVKEPDSFGSWKIFGVNCERS